MKSILGVSLLILLVPGAYAAELPGDSDEGKRLQDAKLLIGMGSPFKADDAPLTSSFCVAFGCTGLGCRA